MEDILTGESGTIKTGRMHRKVSWEMRWAQKGADMVGCINRKPYDMI